MSPKNNACITESGSGLKQTKINQDVVELLLMIGQQALDHFPQLDEITDNKKRQYAQYLKSQISPSIAETSTSIFSPSHRFYILRGGCP